MGRPRTLPTYRLHKHSGLAVVTLNDPDGRRRDVLLGKHGTVASWGKYGRVLWEWAEAGCRLTPEYTFGRRLSALRCRAGVSQAQLAERSGVPLETIVEYEQDRREPLLSLAAKLARALDRPLEEFLPNGSEDAAPV